MRTINAKSASNPYAVSRRTFLRATGAFASAVAFAHVNRALSADKLDGKIMTVLGPIAPEQLGVTLPHEHAVVDFLGAEKVRAIFTQLLPDSANPDSMKMRFGDSPSRTPPKPSRFE